MDITVAGSSGSSSEPEPTPQKCASFSQFNLSRRGSKKVVRDYDGGVSRAYVDVDGIVYRHSHLGDIYATLPPGGDGVGVSCAFQPPDGHLPSSLFGGHSPSSQSDSYRHHVGDGEDKTHAPVGGRVQWAVGRSESATRPPSMTITTPTKKNMEVAVPLGSRKTPRSSGGGKLGGLLSRLASFRFSSRKSSNKKNNNDINAGKSLQSKPSMSQVNKTSTHYKYKLVQQQVPIPISHS